MVYLIILIYVGKGRLLMSNLFICYPKCTTCQKAKAWLDEHDIFYDMRNIKEENPTADELSKWIKDSGFPVKRFFNTSGILYKELNLKEQLQSMPESEQINLLSTDGMLVKRPILVTEKSVLVGFRAAEWEAALI